MNPHGYTLDANRNNISDNIDEIIGANITQSDMHSITIDERLYYLVDTNHDGIFDILFNPTTNTKSPLGHQENTQLIDTNGDGRIDRLRQWIGSGTARELHDTDCDGWFDDLVFLSDLIAGKLFDPEVDLGGLACTGGNLFDNHTLLIL